MSSYAHRIWLAALVAGGALGWAAAASACDGAGVIIRIEGRPQDVQISRTEAGAPTTVSRPRVLEVVCRSDVIRTTGTTFVVLSIDGAPGNVTVKQNAVYSVPARAGAPSAVGNGYRALSDQVLPDMKRLPWNVRLKGAGEDFGFALPGLSAGGEKLESGPHPLLIRLVGGTAPYKVAITDAKGVVVATKDSPDHEVLFDKLALADGAYQITASDATPRSLTAAVTVVDTPPPPTEGFSDLSDPEVRVAASATTLARTDTPTWSLEAEQQLAAAPPNGLDRDKVYELIESYGSD
jgi:hypothetical protein